MSQAADERTARRRRSGMRWSATSPGRSWRCSRLPQTFRMATVNRGVRRRSRRRSTARRRGRWSHRPPGPARRCPARRGPALADPAAPVRPGSTLTGGRGRAVVPAGHRGRRPHHGRL